jgi:hypothetical protein
MAITYEPIATTTLGTAFLALHFHQLAALILTLLLLLMAARLVQIIVLWLDLTLIQVEITVTQQ